MGSERATRRRFIGVLTMGAAGVAAPADAKTGVPPPAPPGRIWVCIPVEAWNAMLAVGRLELERGRGDGA